MTFMYHKRRSYFKDPFKDLNIFKDLSSLTAELQKPALPCGEERPQACCLPALGKGWREAGVEVGLKHHQPGMCWGGPALRPGRLPTPNPPVRAVALSTWASSQLRWNISLVSGCCPVLGHEDWSRLTDGRAPSEGDWKRLHVAQLSWWDRQATTFP